MFLLIALLCSCMTSLVLADQKKDFVYHTGYGESSRKYVDKLRAFHPKFETVCDGAFDRGLDQWGNKQSSTLDISVNKYSCDWAIKEMYTIYTAPKSSMRNMAAVHSLATLITHEMKDPLEKESTKYDLMEKIQEFVERDTENNNNNSDTNSESYTASNE